MIRDGCSCIDLETRAYTPSHTKRRYTLNLSCERLLHGNLAGKCFPLKIFMCKREGSTPPWVGGGGRNQKCTQSNGFVVLIF